MDRMIVTARYVNSLIGSIPLQNQITALEELAGLRILFDRYRVYHYLQDLRVPGEEKKEFISKITERISVESTEIRNFFYLLIDNNLTFLLQDMLIYAEKRLEVIRGLVQVEVQTPSYPDRKIIDMLKAKLEKRLNRKVHISISINKELIGGLIIIFENHILDLSVKTQLEKFCCI
jgi:F-type H+-transporting ATPase subunit delta